MLPIVLILVMKRNSSLSSNCRGKQTKSKSFACKKSAGRTIISHCVQNTAGTHAVKVRDDLVENPETLDASVVDAFFSVEVREVGDGGEHHTCFIV